jgi:hypothetical protein
MVGLALCGSLTLITYLGPETVAERVKILPPCYQAYFHIGFCLWWTLQAAGVPFSAYERSLLELRCAQIICRLGMLGTVPICLAMHSNSALSLGVGHFEDPLCRSCRREWINHSLRVLGFGNPQQILPLFLLCVASLVHFGSFLLVRLLNHAITQANVFYLALCS